MLVRSGIYMEAAGTDRVRRGLMLPRWVSIGAWHDGVNAVGYWRWCYGDVDMPYPPSPPPSLSSRVLASNWYWTHTFITIASRRAHATVKRLNLYWAIVRRSWCSSLINIGGSAEQHCSVLFNETARVLYYGSHKSWVAEETVWIWRHTFCRRPQRDIVHSTCGTGTAVGYSL